MNTEELQAIKRRYNIVGNCNALNRALDIALQVAPTDLSVLIEGESGVGKEIVPRVIHEQSPRRREKYFAINCGSIPEGTIDSELFGHDKGSFTGAIGESVGYFGAANKGTIFLDEVGELPLQTQARLLRVLETGEYIRVGGTEIRKTDVRIVAATNVNMRKAISEGRFREDLYYRLNTIPIQMPPLRERGDDIALLFRLFAMQMAEKYRMDRITLTDDARRMLMKYKWPGNVRQLKNITEQMSILSEQRLIDAETLKKFIPVDPESTMLATVNNGGSHSYESERELLYKVLYELRGNVSDLRRELNGLREKLDNSNMQYVPSASVLHSHTASQSPQQHVEIAYAEEVNDNDSKNEIKSQRPPTHGNNTSQIADSEEVLNLEDLERQVIVRALERHNGNRRAAANELGFSDRTLYRKIKQYKLKEDDDKDPLA